VLEFLEKNWAPALPRASAVRLAVRALLEVVDSGAKNMEIAVIAREQALQVRISREFMHSISFHRRSRRKRFKQSLTI